MERKYKAIVTGPKEYLPGGILVEEFVITQEDINEYLSEDDSETEEDAINYYKEEYIAVWAQRWCNAQLINEDKVIDHEYDDPNGGHNGQRFSPAKNELPLFDDDDGEEEEEEDEWDDWK
jgi:hypothetical protein